jgi:hypothetical protein
MWSIFLIVFVLVTAGTAFSTPAHPAANPKQSRYGPYHTSGGQGASKKAYSPFDECQKAQARPINPKDYLKGRLNWQASLS